MGYWDGQKRIKIPKAWERRLRRRQRQHHYVLCMRLRLKAEATFFFFHLNYVLVFFFFFVNSISNYLIKLLYTIPTFSQ